MSANRPKRQAASAAIAATSQAYTDYPINASEETSRAASLSPPPAKAGRRSTMASPGKKHADEEDEPMEEEEDEDDEEEATARRARNARGRSSPAASPHKRSVARKRGSFKSPGKRRDQEEEESQDASEDEERQRGGKRNKRQSKEEEEDAAEDNEDEEMDDTKRGSPKKGGRANETSNKKGHRFGPRRAVRESFPIAESEEPDPEQVQLLAKEIDANGNLLQPGVSYLCQTFTLSTRHPGRLYALTSDVSRQLGFRDTFWLLSKSPTLRRLEADDAEVGELLEKTTGIALPYQKVRWANIVTIFDVYSAYRLQITNFANRAVSGVAGNHMTSTSLAAAGMTQASLEEMTPGQQQFYSQPVDTRRAFGRPVIDAAEYFGDVNPILKDLLLSTKDFNQRLRQQRLARVATFQEEEHLGRPMAPVHYQPQKVTVLSGGLFSGSGSYDVHFYASPPTSEQPNGQIRAIEGPTASFADFSFNQFRPLYATEAPEKYPIATMPGQYQTAQPVHVSRFKPPVMVEKPVDAQPSRAASAAKRKVEAVEVNNTCPNCPKKVRLNPELAAKVEDTVFKRCTVCKEKYHYACMENMTPILQMRIAQAPSWQCSDCKQCATCQRAEDDDQILFCDDCDKGYHMQCCQPPLRALPNGYFHCHECAVCSSCETKVPPSSTLRHVLIDPRTGKDAAIKTVNVSGEESRQVITHLEQTLYLGSLCNDCSTKWDDTHFCPVCLATYDEDDEELPMVCCDTCDRWIHRSCDTENLVPEDKWRKVSKGNNTYYCPICSSEETKKWQETAPIERNTYTTIGGNKEATKLAMLGETVICIPEKFVSK